MLSRSMFLRMTGVAGVVSMAGATPVLAQALPQPTKAEMLEAIQKSMNETYLSENGRSIWGNTAISISTTEPKIGQLMSKQMYSGKQAQPVWPVRLVVSVTVTSTKRATETIKWGDKPDSAWFFHKNSFGEWAYRLGTE